MSDGRHYFDGWIDALKAADEAIRTMPSPPSIRGISQRDWEAYWRGARTARAEVQVSIGEVTAERTEAEERRASGEEGGT